MLGSLTGHGSYGTEGPPRSRRFYPVGGKRSLPTAWSDTRIAALDPLTIRIDRCSREHMDLYERLRQSEQSRRLAWQVLQ
jgi:hypothetical protein